MSGTLALLAGTASTVIFALSALPMLIKAGRTKDLGSYSLGNIVLANIGNVIYSIYVFQLPAGPVWVLHSFYVMSSALMLVWYVRYVKAGRDPSRPRIGQPTPHARLIASADAAISDFSGGQSVGGLGRHRSAMGRLGASAHQ